MRMRSFLHQARSNTNLLRSVRPGQRNDSSIGLTKINEERSSPVQYVFTANGNEILLPRMTESGDLIN